MLFYMLPTTAPVPTKVTTLPGFLLACKQIVSRKNQYHSFIAKAKTKFISLTQEVLRTLTLCCGVCLEKHTPRNGLEPDHSKILPQNSVVIFHSRKRLPVHKMYFHFDLAKVWNWRSHMLCLQHSIKKINKPVQVEAQEAGQRLPALQVLSPSCAVDDWSFQ